MTDDPVRAAERAAEAELADMEAKGRKVEQHIQEVRRDWADKKRDPEVPGAAGDPERAEEGGRHPETAYPAKGSSDELGEEE
jgi:multidrug resistance efflux pump